MKTIWICFVVFLLYFGLFTVGAQSFDKQALELTISRTASEVGQVTKKLNRDQPLLAIIDQIEEDKGDSSALTKFFSERIFLALKVTVNLTSHFLLFAIKRNTETATNI